MLKKYISYIGVLILAIFSFYYTDKATDIIKMNDPIMKEILSNSNNYYVEPVNAIINNDEIKPGNNGKKVNINSSYKKMKSSNKYNENMYVFDEINPNITFVNNFDKYIVSGNPNYNKVTLILKVLDSEFLNEINKILLEKNIVATVFIDGSVIESNIDDITEFSNNGYEIENLGYDMEYKKDMFNWTNNLLFSITKKNPKFCYTDYRNNEILDLCKNNNMYTIKPSINIDNNYPFKEIKNNLENGAIFSLNINEQVLKELPSIISYIKQKGYTLVNLEELVSENLVEEK